MEIVDDGPVIPQDIQPRIFEQPFTTIGIGVSNRNYHVAFKKSSQS